MRKGGAVKRTQRGETNLPSAGVLQKRRKQILSETATGIIIAIVFAIAMTYVEKYDFIQLVEKSVYEWLQLRLQMSGEAHDTDVRVVDISGIEKEKRPSNPLSVAVTPRDELTRVLDAVAAQKPAAIGIDVNFDFDRSSGQPSDDRKFLADCFSKAQEKKIRIYVAIHHALANYPEAWLGDPNYRGMAAFVTVPNPEDHEITTRMSEFMRVDYTGRAGDAARHGVVFCPSLSAALANREWKPISSLLGFFMQRIQGKQNDQFAVSEFLIDFGPLPTLMRHTLTSDRLLSSDDPGELLTKKIVLIGRAKQTTDNFSVPTSPLPIAGVFVHACAAHTLLYRPLYRLTAPGRIFGDLFAALFVFGGIFAIRWHRSAVVSSEQATSRLHVILTSCAVLLILMAALLVNWTRLMWTDFVLVIFALVVHSPIERLIASTGHALRIGRSAHHPRKGRH